MFESVWARRVNSIPGAGEGLIDQMACTHTDTPAALKVPTRPPPPPAREIRPPCQHVAGHSSTAMPSRVRRARCGARARAMANERVERSVSVRISEIFGRTLPNGSCSEYDGRVSYANLRGQTRGS